jgi:hypothetical protein
MAAGSRRQGVIGKPPGFTHRKIFASFVSCSQFRHVLWPTSAQVFITKYCKECV